MMSNSAYSQNGYPKQIVYDGIPGIFITYKQVRYINLAHNTWSQCEETNDSLLATVDSCKVADSLYLSIISRKDSTILLRGQAISDRDGLITVQKEHISKQDKSIRKLRTKSSILGISTGVLGLAAVVLVILL